MKTFSTVAATLGMASLAASAAIPEGARVVPRGGGVSLTPHMQFSSSMGVLGCKIDTNYVVYWPGAPGCDNLCKKVTGPLGNSVHVLHIDSSAGAYDMSYLAWNILKTGKTPKEQDGYGGGMDVTWEDAPMSDCNSILDGGKLPLSAPTAMNSYAGCPAGSWVRDNTIMYNIVDSQCKYGVDEKCTPPNLDIGENNPTCPHQLGVTTPLEGMAVVNIGQGGVETSA